MFICTACDTSHESQPHLTVMTCVYQQVFAIAFDNSRLQTAAAAQALGLKYCRQQLHTACSTLQQTLSSSPSLRSLIITIPESSVPAVPVSSPHVPATVPAADAAVNTGVVPMDTGVVAEVAQPAAPATSDDNPAHGTSSNTDAASARPSDEPSVASAVLVQAAVAVPKLISRQLFTEWPCIRGSVDTLSDQTVLDSLSVLTVHCPPFEQQRCAVQLAAIKQELVCKLLFPHTVCEVISHQSSQMKHLFVMRVHVNGFIRPRLPWSTVVCFPRW